MADPPSDSGYPATIVLARRGLNPDVHLQVFSQEFHAHSMNLKTNSDFFRSFFDSADKNLRASDSRFKYMWVTKVDDDGTWSLVWKHTKRDPNEASQMTVADIPLQIHAFKTILYAMYNKRIILVSVAHLVLCTKLADYYRCLPMFSKAVTSAIMNSPNLVDSIPKECCTILETAAKLRNELLFRECLIHTTGPWIKPQYQNLQDPVLKTAGEKAYGSIMNAIAKYHEDTLELAQQIGYSTQANRSAEETEIFKLKLAKECPRDELQEARLLKYRLRLPEYYRKLYTNIGHGIPESYESLLRPLVQNNLRFDRSGELSGKGQYAQYFLCAHISDDDLPWDVDQDDW